MPELPEVETVARELSHTLPGRKILSVWQSNKKLREPLPRNLNTKLAGRKIKSVERRAKFIIIHLSGGLALLAHLGMSGRIIVRPDGDINGEKHDHIVMKLDKGKTFVFNDPRRFGLFTLVNEKDLAGHKALAGIGREPLEEDFDASYLVSGLKKRHGSIKSAIMDQKLLAGVGNIYASEALFWAGIDPRRSASSISLGEVKKLVTAIKKVLRASIKAGGSSLRNYVRSSGENGDFQKHWAVYNKEGESCPLCKREGLTCNIKRIVQSGRATYYCPARQS